MPPLPSMAFKTHPLKGVLLCFCTVYELRHTHNFSLSEQGQSNLLPFPYMESMTHPHSHPFKTLNSNMDVKTRPHHGHITQNSSAFLVWTQRHAHILIYDPQDTTIHSHFFCFTFRILIQIHAYILIPLKHVWSYSRTDIP